MRSTLTRREMLRLGAAGLVGLGLQPRRLLGKGAPAAGEFTFIAVNDLHFSDALCRPWFDEVVAQMKRSAPTAEFCLLGGDLADEGSPEQLSGVREAFARLGMPVHAVVGNHDYLPGTSDRSAYERIFPGQINYHFPHRGWQVLGLDTTEGTQSRDTFISDATLRWLDATLPQLAPEKPTIVLTHFPLGIFTPARPRNANALLARLAKLNLRAAFSGHFHGFTVRPFGSAALTTDRCCSRIRANHDGSPQKGWFVCEASGERVRRQFVEFQARG